MTHEGVAGGTVRCGATKLTVPVLLGHFFGDIFFILVSYRLLTQIDVRCIVEP